MSYHSTTIDLTTEQRATLRACREKLGLNQSELGALADCSRVMIYQIESGKKSPSYGLLVAISRALALDVRLSLVRSRS